MWNDSDVRLNRLSTVTKTHGQKGGPKVLAHTLSNQLCSWQGCTIPRKGTFNPLRGGFYYPSPGEAPLCSLHRKYKCADSSLMKTPCMFWFQYPHSWSGVKLEEVQRLKLGVFTALIFEIVKSWETA